jgi:uncharacterized protein YbaA (DUF1428 family)
MSYIDGFVIPVPTANRDRFIAHAKLGDAVFMEQGATRILECWQDDVTHGKTTDFFDAVDAHDDESVVFSWIEWPDKATRDATYSKMEELSKDDRYNPDKNPMPFDGKRMIYGGFSPILDEGHATHDAYVQGFVIPVPEGKREAYRKMAADVWQSFKENGALRVVEAWGDDVPDGKQTDFRRSVKAEGGERIVFSFVEWPSREVCDLAAKNMKPPEGMEIPFDTKRMIYGGFAPVVELGDK